MGEAKPVNVKDGDFENEVLKSQIPVLVDFWAPWCGPCRMVSPVIDKIAEGYQGRLKVCKINVQEGQQTATKLGVMSVPTLHLFKDGKVVEQIAGITSDLESDLKKKIEPYL